MKNYGIESKNYQFRCIYMYSKNNDDYWDWHFFNESNKIIGKPNYMHEKIKSNLLSRKGDINILDVMIEKRTLFNKKTNFVTECQFWLSFRNRKANNRRIGYCVDNDDQSLEIRDDKILLNYAKYHYYPIFACDGCICHKDQYGTCYQMSFQQ